MFCGIIWRKFSQEPVEMNVLSKGVHLSRVGALILLLSVLVTWSLGEAIVWGGSAQLTELGWIVLVRWMPRIALCGLAVGTTVVLVRAPRGLGSVWVGFGLLLVVWVLVYASDWLYWWAHFGPMPAVVR